MSKETMKHRGDKRRIKANDIFDWQIKNEHVICQKYTSNLFFSSQLTNTWLSNIEYESLII